MSNNQGVGFIALIVKMFAGIGVLFMTCARNADNFIGCARGADNVSSFSHVNKAYRPNYQNLDNLYQSSDLIKKSPANKKGSVNSNVVNSDQQLKSEALSNALKIPSDVNRMPADEKQENPNKNNDDQLDYEVHKVYVKTYLTNFNRRANYFNNQEKMFVFQLATQSSSQGFSALQKGLDKIDRNFKGIKLLFSPKSGVYRLYKQQIWDNIRFYSAQKELDSAELGKIHLVENKYDFISLFEKGALTEVQLEFLLTLQEKQNG